MKLLVKLTLHRLRNGINVYMLVKRTRLSLVQIIVEKKSRQLHNVVYLTNKIVSEPLVPFHSSYVS